jgi:surface carbohydrate biosynthesis protein
MNNYDREQTLLKLGIDHNKKIILFTSQPVTDEENFVLLQEIFDEFSKLSEDFHLIIKLHPAEDGRLHKNIAKNFKNYSIIQNIDIFEIINASDIVITYWSTTGLEAMVFGKPLIVLNLSGKPDKVDYVKEDAALGVYNKNNLSKSIMKCLDDSEFNKKMIESQKKFIYKEAYKIDGHVAKRLLNIVYGMMKK